MHEQDPPRSTATIPVASGTLPVIEGRYRLERELGRGGMGWVFAARDLRLGRDVAVKLLAPGPHTDVQLLRFEQEARAAGSLEHENILAVHDVGNERGSPYIVSELLHGGTLRERLEAAPIPARKALEYSAQLARGLCAAHQKGIVHRDLKPENLFVTEEGRIKILDFGIAKLTFQKGRPNDTLPAAQTGTGAFLGTVGYMSPEQVRGDLADARSDIFAFGTILHEMLTGTRLFQRESDVETAYAILKVRPPELPGTVPREIGRFVRKCLEKEPADRFQTARELVDWIDDFLASPAGARLPTSEHAHRPFAVRTGLRRPLVAAAVAVVTVVSLVVWWTTRPQGQPLSTNVVAVLPFVVRGSSHLAYLSEGMVDLLGTNLSGAEVRAVDPDALLRFAARNPAAMDVSRGRAIAKHFGAGRFMLGSVLEVGTRLRVHAALYGTDDGESPSFEANAEGDMSQLSHMVDEITAQLIGRIRRVEPGKGPGGRLARLGEKTTHSAEALKLYLEGEAELRRGFGSWRRAKAVLERAVELDPEFALAHYRLAVAASIWEPGLSTDALQRALTYGDRLSDRDRALMQAFAALRQGRAADAEQRYRALLNAYPDEVEGWYELGDLLFHYNPLRGKPSSDAREPLERALLFDPAHGGALDHLIDIAHMQGQREVVAALADRFLQVVGDEPALSLPLRWIKSWSTRDEAGRSSLLEQLRAPGTSREALISILGYAIWQGDDLSDAEAIAQLLAEDGAPDRRAEGLESLAALDLARGRLRAAREKLSRAARLSPEGPYRMDALAIAALDFFPMSPDELRRAREGVAALAATDPLRAARRTFLLGSLAARAGDPDGAEQAARELERMSPIADSSIAGDLALAVRALAAYHAGKSDEALAALERMKLQVPYPLSGIFVRISEQHLRARLLQEQGRNDDALRWYGVFYCWGRFEPVYFAESHLRSAAILEARGARKEASEHYRRFIALWAGSDPELRPRVEEATRRLRAMEASTGSSTPAP
jgi:tetratricopeptide (TPR) repeat protein/TolB-like protein